MKKISLIEKTLEGSKLHELKNKDIIMIGRSSGNDIVVKSEGSQYVSKVHCGIVIKENGVYIFDNQSTNGTKLNGVQVEPVELYKLNDGDEIVLGFSREFIFGINQDNKQNLETVI